MMPLVAAAAVAVSFCSFSLFIYWAVQIYRQQLDDEARQRRGELPPGPKGLPLLGNLGLFLEKKNSGDCRRKTWVRGAHGLDETTTTTNHARSGLSEEDDRKEATTRRPRRLVPGGGRILSAVWTTILRGWRRRPVAQVFADVAAAHGPVVWLNVCGRRFVVLNDGDAIRNACLDSRGDFDYRPDDRQFAAMGKHAGVFSADGPAQQRNRRFLQRAFRDVGVGGPRVTAIINAECRELVDYLKEANGQPIDPRLCIPKAVFNVSSNVLSGKRFSWEDKSLRSLVHSVRSTIGLEVAGIFNFVPIFLVPFFYGTAPLRALLELLKVSWYSNRAVAERRSASCPVSRKLGVCHENEVGVGHEDDGQHRLPSVAVSATKEYMDTEKLEWNSDRKRRVLGTNVIDCYLNASWLQKSASSPKAESGPYLDYDAEVVPTARDIVIAGLETTATTLGWAFLLLAVHRGVQRKLRNELDLFCMQRKAGDEVNDSSEADSTGIRGSFPQYEDREHLPYAEAVLLEILRWSSALPLAGHATAPRHPRQPRRTFETAAATGPADGHAASATQRGPSSGVLLCGYRIPPGCPVYLNLYAAHREKAVWNRTRDPSVFDPRNFLDDDGKSVVNRDKLLGFSLGRRSCSGKGLVMQELFCFIACITRLFEIELPEGADVEPLDILCGEYGVTWAPPDHRLRFIPRQLSS